jgi:hypothetical protein
MDLDNLLEQVEDEASFFRFAKALQADKEDEGKQDQLKSPSPYTHGWNGWQNSNIEGFIESAIAFTEDSKPWSDESNLWKKFALFLYGGKIYE